MRTSRIAQRTTQVVEALSPRRRIQNVTNGIGRAINGSSLVPEQASEQDGSLEDVPKDIEISTHHVAKSTGKRKRSASSATENLTAPQKTETISISETTTSQTSRLAASNDKPNESIPAYAKKARRQPAKKIKGPDGLLKVEPPPNWQEVYALTKQMRSLWQAPVDTMGCESLAEDKRSPRDRRFQTLVALMLSSQTKDTVTSVAMKNLQEGMPGGFTLESMLKIEPGALNDMISKVGFHNNKTKYLKQAAPILRDKWDSDIPDSIEGLVDLPGVGPKMAYLCMSAAWGKDVGIGVDVHVHRITNLWGWHKTQTPEETRAALESWLPREKWHDINHLLVGFGQTWCPPVGRKCEQCKLAERGLCPSAVVKKIAVERVSKRKVKDEDVDGHEVVKEEADIKVGLHEADITDVANGTAGTSDMLQGSSVDMEDLGLSRRRSKRLRS